MAGIPNSPAEMQIYDLRGALVYQRSAANRDEILWDGMTSDGAPAASGVYFLQINQADSNTELLKFAIVR